MSKQVINMVLYLLCCQVTCKKRTSLEGVGYWFGLLDRKKKEEGKWRMVIWNRKILFQTYIFATCTFTSHYVCHSVTSYKTINTAGAYFLHGTLSHSSSPQNCMDPFTVRLFVLIYRAFISLDCALVWPLYYQSLRCVTSLFTCTIIIACSRCVIATVRRNVYHTYAYVYTSVE